MRPALAAMVVSQLVGCTWPGPAEGRRHCVHWESDIKTELQAQCTRCHSGPDPAGAYDLSTYKGVLGTGTDAVPNAEAGRSGSRILEAIRQGAANATHQAFTESYTLMEQWVVECRLSYSGSGIHPPGFANPAEADFHGAALRNDNWNMATCQRCHGEDFSGGAAGQSCLECHQQGPTGCNVCHAEKPTSGAHTAHLTAPITAHPVDCSSCHRVPSDWRDPGHIFLADGSRDPSPAEVVLTGPAAADVHPERRNGPPAFDGVGCSNVACHGDTLGGTDRTFTWQAPTQASSCTRCHDTPPPTHMQQRACVECHQQVVDAQDGLVRPDLHINALVEVGPPGNNCQGCHQENPFRDSQGRQDPMLSSVGAHDAHLQPRTFMAAPVACTGCHRVPTRAGDPGHLDSDLPAEVFSWTPEALGLGGMRGASPVYDAQNASCSATYCHGGGTVLAADTSPTVVRTVPWTPPGAFQVVCGSCHGIPPVDVNHTPDMNSQGCVQCHSGTVNGFGVIVFAPDGTSLHINGAADADP